MSKDTTATPSAATQTKTATVKLVMHSKQAFASAVELDGYTFKKGEPVEVENADAEALLGRRDEYGKPYVKKA